MQVAEILILRDCTTVLPRENEKQRNETVKRIGGVPYWLFPLFRNGVERLI